ncbi:hypothetical protein HYT92_00360 [Candidatus Pacearchaeota archaeon]|nr:hypothetical protein [Candidatus Pacearchaeota archaeon]
MAKKKRLSEIIQKTAVTGFETKETHPTIKGLMTKDTFISYIKTKMYFPNKIRFSTNVNYKSVQVITTITTDKGGYTFIRGYKGRIAAEHPNYRWINGCGYHSSSESGKRHADAIKSLKMLYQENQIL